MGMGLRRRGRKRGRIGMRRNKRLRFRSRHRGGLGAKLFLACCGGKNDQDELQQQEIMQLQMAQQMMLMSLTGQGGSVMYTTNGQPGTQVLPGQQVGAYGTQYPSGQPNTFVPTQYGVAPSGQGAAGFPPEQQSAGPYGTQNPSGQPNASSLYGGVGSSNAVAPSGPPSTETIKEHQEQQVQLLNEIMAQHSVEKDPKKVNELAGQYNTLIEQMKSMEAAGYSYPNGIPPPIAVVDNQQYVQNTG